MDEYESSVIAIEETFSWNEADCKQIDTLRQPNKDVKFCKHFLFMQNATDLFL